MNLRSLFIVLAVASILLTSSATPVFCERSAYLALCQELVSQARAYQARAEAHNRVAKAYMIQIENLAKSASNQSTSLAMDNLFAQYDQNRKLEAKFRELYRQATEEARLCMNSID